MGRAIDKTQLFFTTSLSGNCMTTAWAIRTNWCDTYPPLFFAEKRHMVLTEAKYIEDGSAT